MTPGPSGVPERFRVELEPHRETIVVAAHGDLDIATAEPLRAKLQEVVDAGFRRVVLDLRAVSFIDSSGLRVILEARTGTADAGVDFALIPGPDSVQRLFEVTGTDSVLRFVDEHGVDRS